jgi:hypothetical protein
MLIKHPIPGPEPPVLPDTSHVLVETITEFDGHLCHITMGRNSEHDVVKKQGTRLVPKKYLKREMNVIKRLRKLSPNIFVKYLPEPVGDTYLEHGEQTNMFIKADGFYTLDEVIAQYPSGIEPEDLAWMGNRLFEVVAYANAYDVIHGCINTSNFLINPKTHGGMLIDWCYSVNRGKPIEMIVVSNESDYPPEVRSKNPATERTDSFMIGKTLLKLVEEGTDRKITGFLRSLTIDAYAYRPHGTYELMTKFKAIQFELFGNASFHSFTMPPQN